MVKKNDTAELTVLSTARNGNGIAKAADGMTVFIRNTCAGDVVRAKIIKVTRSYAVAIPQEILLPSPDRLPDDDCPVSAQCGGCVFRHLTYASECTLKENSIRDAFVHIAKLSVTPEPLIPALAVQGYRNKAVYPVARNKDGRMIAGFYAEMSHRLVAHDTCRIGPSLFSAIRTSVIAFAESHNIPPYDEADGSGILRSVYLRSAADGKVVLTLILAKDRLVSPAVEQEFCRYITGTYPMIVSVVVNKNDLAHNAVLGKEFRTIYGDGYLYDTLCGRKFRIAPASFYQVNHDQAEKLYGKAREFASLKSGETLLDLYCGTGTVGICLAEKDTHLVGVEIVPQAVEDAHYNAEQNGIDASFLCLDAEKALDDNRLTEIRPDVITLDPPRKGCGEQASRKIASLGASRIVYISCNPETLARDLVTFSECGYRVMRSVGVDMFPRTGHVECVVLLSRVNKQRIQQ